MVLPLRHLEAKENLLGCFTMGGIALGKCSDYSQREGQIQLSDKSKRTYILPGKLGKRVQLYLFPPDFITWRHEESSTTLLKLLPPTKCRSRNVYA